MKLRYVKDISGDELLEDEDSQHQIMMEWEIPIMKEHAKICTENDCKYMGCK